MSFPAVLLFLLLAACHAFVISPVHHRLSVTSLYAFDAEDSEADPEGADLAAQLFQMAQAKGVSLNADDLLDEEEDEDEDEEEEPNIPQGAINAFLGYDTGDVGDLAGNVSLTDDQLYSEVKDRVLDTAGGFLELVGGASDDDAEDALDAGPKPYEPPTTVFGYSSSGSSIRNEEGLTPAEYATFLKETEYKVLFDHQEVVSVFFTHPNCHSGKERQTHLDHSDH